MWTVHHDQNTTIRVHPKFKNQNDPLLTHTCAKARQFPFVLTHIYQPPDFYLARSSSGYQEKRFVT